MSNPTNEELFAQTMGPLAGLFANIEIPPLDYEAGRQTYAHLEPQTSKAMQVLVGGVAILGIGAIGVSVWGSWVIAGAIALKLGLIGFWWHLLLALPIVALITTTTAKIVGGIVRAVASL